MHYDPIKHFLGAFFNRWVFTRRLFYALLDLLLLRTWHIHKELRAYFKQSKHKKDVSVLDAGSGFGQYTFYLARKQPSWNILGTDIKEDEISSCTAFFESYKLHNARFEIRDLVTYKNPAAFDLIVNVDVMEHIVEDEQVLSNFFQSLKPEGLLLINTPSNQGGSDVMEPGDASFIGEHVRDGYGVAEMQNKLQNAGFTDIDIRYTYGKPGNISWKLSMKYPIIWLNISRFFIILLPLYYLLVMPFVIMLNVADVWLKHTSGTGLLVKARKH